MTIPGNFLRDNSFMEPKKPEPRSDLFLDFVALDRHGEETMHRRTMVTVDDPLAYVKAMLELHNELHEKEKLDASNR